MFSVSIADAAALGCGIKGSGASHGGRPKTRWWTPEVRDPVMFKKEFYLAMMAYRAL